MIINKNNPEIDDCLADCLDSWPDVEEDPAVQQRIAEAVTRELKISHRLSIGADEEESSIKIIFIFVGAAVTGLLLFGVASPFGWDALSSCLAVLLPVPIKYAILYTCFAVLISLMVLLVKMQKGEVLNNE